MTRASGAHFRGPPRVAHTIIVGLLVI